MNPEELRYTAEHEWIRTNPSGTITFGITHFAQDSLGDIVYVSLPKAGEVLAAGQPCGEVESTKSVSELFSPVSGKVIAINQSLEANPEVLNSDPYGAGWLADIEISAQPEGLLSADGYRQITA